jgi:RimJ/RimL family protein N-acetyltransferase
MRASSYRFPDELRIDELTVRYPSADDIEIIAPAFLDPEIGGEAGLPPVGPELLLAALATEIPRMRDNGLLCPYVIAGPDGALLGGLALHHFDPMRDTLEVGYWLLREARGRGVATRSVQGAIDHAFENGIWRIEAHVRVGNVASEGVLERLGFEREGVKRRYLRHDGERVDATLFSLLAPD